MPNMPGTTRRQTIFLRSFLKNPAGPSPADWPSAPILRRWLRRPAFLRALNTIRQTLHFQSDLLLAFASTSAALALNQPPLPDSPNSKTENQKSKIDLLKLSHLRQRFPGSLPQFPTRPTPDPTLDQTFEAFRQVLQLVHPEANARQALEFIEQRIRDADEPFDDSQEAQLARRQNAIEFLKTCQAKPPEHTP